MKKLESAQLPKSTVTLNAVPEMKCGNCVHYMRPKCPRGYDHDTELWRKQEPCEVFQPAKTISGKRQ